MTEIAGVTDRVDGAVTARAVAVAATMGVGAGAVWAGITFCST